MTGINKKIKEQQSKETINNNSTVVTLQNKPGPLDNEVRNAAKQMLLEALGQTNIVSTSCARAGISRVTYEHWCEIGFITQNDLLSAHKQYQDMLRAEISRRTFVGEMKPLVANGRLVYDRQGKEVSIHHKDTRLLIELAKRNLPEWAPQTKLSALPPGMDVPSQFLLVIDSRELLPDELDFLTKVAQRIEDKKNGVVESE